MKDQKHSTADTYLEGNRETLKATINKGLGKVEETKEVTVNIVGVRGVEHSRRLERSLKRLVIIFN